MVTQGDLHPPTEDIHHITPLVLTIAGAVRLPVRDFIVSQVVEKEDILHLDHISTVVVANHQHLMVDRGMGATHYRTAVTLLGKLLRAVHPRMAQG